MGRASWVTDKKKPVHFLWKKVFYFRGTLYSFVNLGNGGSQLLFNPFLWLTTIWAIFPFSMGDDASGWVDPQGHKHFFVHFC